MSTATNTIITNTTTTTLWPPLPLLQISHITSTTTITKLLLLPILSFLTLQKLPLLYNNYYQYYFHYYYNHYYYTTNISCIHITGVQLLVVSLPPNVPVPPVQKSFQYSVTNTPWDIWNDIVKCPLVSLLLTIHTAYTAQPILVLILSYPAKGFGDSM